MRPTSSPASPPLEVPLVFPCEGETLLGILHLPKQPHSRGVVIVVGGPQYRVGSHRQFVLLARDLALAGISVLRFDYRGMGDSGGDPVDFESCGPDIRAAVDRFFAEVPGLEEVVLWGLCDAASAICFYAHTDSRVRGVVLLNPWVRTDTGEARARVKHYYGRRLLDREFWKKLMSGQWDWKASVGSFARIVRQMFEKTSQGDDAASLPLRMAASLSRFRGRILLILSGNDLTAAEFLDACSSSPPWKQILASSALQRRDLDEANHTFSRRKWRNSVSEWTRQWVLEP